MGAPVAAEAVDALPAEQQQPVLVPVHLLHRPQSPPSTTDSYLYHVQPYQQRLHCQRRRYRLYASS